MVLKADEQSQFTQATNRQCWGRLAAMGPSGTGKTYTLFRVARALMEILPEERQRMAVIGGEAEATVKYKQDFEDLEYSYFQPQTHSPERYAQLIDRAVYEGFGVLLIDSLSNPWAGLGGTLEIVDAATTESSNKNSFTSGWKVGSPVQNALVQKILTAPIHVLATLRVKTDYVMEQKGNKTVPKAVGLKPIQREGIEYEFDVLVSMDSDLTTKIETTRCSALLGKKYKKASEKDLGKTFAQWLAAGDIAATDAEAAPNADPGPSRDEAAATPPTNGTPIRDSLLRLMTNRCIEVGVEPQKFVKPTLNGIAKQLGCKIGEESLQGVLDQFKQEISTWDPNAPNY